VKVALLFRAWATSTPLSLSDALTVIRGLVVVVDLVVDFVVVVFDVVVVVVDFVVDGGTDVLDAGTLIVFDVDISIAIIIGSLFIVVDVVDILNGVDVSFVDSIILIVVVTLVFDVVVAAIVVVAVVCSVSSFLTKASK